jgi:CheY-like chemotaxis protein
MQMYTKKLMLQPNSSACHPAVIEIPCQIPFWATEHDGPKHNNRKSSSGKGKDPQSQQLGNRVLLFSGIWEVALYRAEVLRGNGFQVLTPRSKEEAIQAIKHGDLDVAVLTYTLPNETVHELAELLRESCPGCPLITIFDSGRVDNKIAPDATVLADQGPAGLIEALRRFAKPEV